MISSYMKLNPQMRVLDKTALPLIPTNAIVDSRDSITDANFLAAVV
jgi:hypothetical protein